MKLWLGGLYAVGVSDMQCMTLYVVVSSLFIYSTSPVSDVASKTRLGMSPKPV